MQIHYAARRGDLAAVKRHLGRGIPIDCRDQEGKTPLMWAAEGRLVGEESLSFFLDLGADPNAVSDNLQDCPLALAARTGSISKVKHLVERGADASFVNDSGYTAITSLTHWETPAHLEVLRYLVEAGADLNQESSFGESPLRTAIARGNLQALKLLLRLGANRESVALDILNWSALLETPEKFEERLRKTDPGELVREDRTPPILFAIFAGDVQKVEMMIAAGSKLDASGRLGKPALTYAAEKGHTKMCLWLLDHGVDPNSHDDFGNSSLEAAAASGSVETVSLLLEAGAAWMSEESECAITSASNAKVVQVLRSAGCDINHIGPDGYGLLKSAAENDEIEFVIDLLQLGADPNATTTGDTALHAAIAQDHLEVAGVLLAGSANVNAQDVDGWTPLMSARSLEAVDLLLHHGANVKLTEQSGRGVIAHHTDPEIIDRLIEVSGPDLKIEAQLNESLYKASQNYDLDLLDWLIGHRVDLNCKTEWGSTALMAACEKDHLVFAQRLIQCGASLELADEEGRTAMHYAAAPEAFYDFHLQQDLCSHEWNANREPRNSLKIETSLAPMTKTNELVSGSKDSIDCLAFLIQAGAALESDDEEGRTPLLLACLYGRPSRVKFLLQKGADPERRDALGNNAFDLTGRHHRQELAEQIRSLLTKQKV